jgi:hypothetical protein
MEREDTESEPLQAVLERRRRIIAENPDFELDELYAALVSRREDVKKLCAALEKAQAIIEEALTDIAKRMPD